MQHPVDRNVEFLQLLLIPYFCATVAVELCLHCSQHTLVHSFALVQSMEQVFYDTIRNVIMIAAYLAGS